MLINDTRKKAREVFDMWFPIFSEDDEKDKRERLFEYFHSGYLAGTKFKGLNEGTPQGCPASLINDDISRNLDL